MAELSSALPLIGNDLAPVFRKRAPKERIAKISYAEPIEPIAVATPVPGTTTALLDSVVAQPLVQPLPRVKRPFSRLHFVRVAVVVASLLVAAGILAVSSLFVHAKLSKAALVGNSRATSTATMTVIAAGLSPALNKIEQQPVSFTIGSNSVTATPGDIAGWLTVARSATAQTTTIGLNLSKISLYLNNVAKQYSHAATAQVTVTHPDGTTATLISGVDGFTVGNTNQTINKIAQGLLGGNGLNVALPGTTIPFTNTAAPPFAKLLEIDLTNKKMYAYQKGQLVKIFLVTAGAPAAPTPTGQFKIYAKNPVQDMNSYNTDGTMYDQPNVQWVDNFYQDDAVYGNYWQPVSVFGKVNTSPGGIGVANSDAEWIYSWAPIGTPVIVHD